MCLRPSRHGLAFSQVSFSEGTYSLLKIHCVVLRTRLSGKIDTNLPSDVRQVESKDLSPPSIKHGKPFNKGQQNASPRQCFSYLWDCGEPLVGVILRLLSWDPWEYAGEKMFSGGKESLGLMSSSPPSCLSSLSYWSLSKREFVLELMMSGCLEVSQEFSSILCWALPHMVLGYHLWSLSESSG